MKEIDPNFPEREQSDLLRRICSSLLFRRSRRLREMLQFIGEHSILHGRSGLREQEIGTAVFGRKPDYDTAADNIVRVNASELRRRLEKYFASEGLDEPVVIELARGGGYGLQFYKRAAFEANREEVSSVPQIVATVDQRDDATPPIVEEPSSAIDRACESSVSSSRAIWLLASMALLLCACALQAAYIHHLKNRLEGLAKSAPSANTTPRVRAFWTPLLEAGRETDLISADNSLSVEEELSKRQVHLQEYLSNNYHNGTQMSGGGQAQELLGILRSRDSGGFADFYVAQRIMSLFPGNSLIRFGSAKDYVPDAIREHNIVIIGSRAANPWVDLYANQLNFVVDWDAEKKHTILINREPRPSEPSEYGYEVVHRDGETVVYSTIALLSNPGGGSSLLIAGCESQGTRAAGDFFTSEEGLLALEKQLPGAHSFEVVLRSSRMAGTTLKTEIVAARREG